MTRVRFLKLLFLFLIVLAACRREEPTSTPTSPAETVESNPTVAQVTADLETPIPETPLQPLISDPDALPRPKVIGRSPEAGEELAVDAAFEIFFDQPMDSEKTAAAWQVVDAEGQVVDGELTFPQPRILQFKPDRPLERNSVYQAQISSEAASAEGLTLLEGLNLTFNTITDLTVSQVSPASGAGDVAIDATITIIFNKPVVPLLIAEEQTDLPNPLTISPPVDGEGEWVNTSVFVFRPSTALQGKTTYTVSVLADAINEVNPTGATLAEDKIWSFVTAPPTYNHFELVGGWTNPSSNMTDLPLDQAFHIFFDQPMDTVSTEAAVSLRPVGDGALIPLTFSWNDPEQPTSLTLTPTQMLELDTRYQLALATTAESASGGQLGRGFTWQARTVPPPSVESTEYRYGTFVIHFASPMSFNSLKDKVLFEPPLVDDDQGYYNSYNNSLQFSNLAPSTDYTVTILPGTSDVYGNEITEETVVNFS
ncbi:MAG: Ig-like domain-containing protein, partial [Candidatus Promineifilaceae bacterium]